MRLECGSAQHFVARLAAAARTEHTQGVAECGHADQSVLRIEVDEGETAAALRLQLQLVEAENEQAAVEREAGNARRAGADDRRRQGLFFAFEREEGLAAALPR